MITPGRLNEMLGASWPHGEVTYVSARRIGQDYGFGGRPHLLEVITSTGAQTLVAKEETAEQIQRVVTAYEAIAEPMAGHIPVLYGWAETTALYEHITPATQGDGLDIRAGQVDTMLGILATVHATTWSESGTGWIPEHWARERWEDRIRRVGARYPDQLGTELRQRLLRLHDEVPGAIEVLRAGPASLVHMDSGFDNTLWRPGGSMVLLDWASARRGPPGYDVASHLVEKDPEVVLTTYHDALAAAGVGLPTDALMEQVAAGLRIMIRGMVGFAGYPDEPVHPRLLDFRAATVPRVRQELEWLDETGL